MRRSAILLASLLVACAGNPAPGEPGYEFNASGPYKLNVEAQGQAYSGMIEMATAAGGAVSGKFSISGAATVTGSMAGTLVGDKFSFDMPYTVTEAGCGGTAKGEATVAKGGDTITGTLTLNDGCAGQATGTFRMTR